jgi:hypothetical protein
MTFGDKILSFFSQLEIKAKLPNGVVVLNPYKEAEAFSYCQKFYKKYYDDVNHRAIIFGINPGRHGGGVTGIPFTDPVKLEQYCKIPNPFNKKPELSADFIYTMIDGLGGGEKFYGHFYISAVSPLGFTLDGRNMNYYDSKELQVALRSFVLDSIEKQLQFGINRDVCYCLGEGENFKYISKLNEEYKFFKKVIPLAHPRFIMQYRRKKIAEYVNDYREKLSVMM